MTHCTRVVRMLYYIVSLHQTTTLRCRVSKHFRLYYIVSLHQTTTVKVPTLQKMSCIISFLYIKPQLIALVCGIGWGCIISFLYIKPQHKVMHILQVIVVLYRFSTSNHNCIYVNKQKEQLYYIVSLHQTTTSCPRHILQTSCIISFLYIKPQLVIHILTLDYCCIISFLYIKPQQYGGYQQGAQRCIISFLYIKPQQGKERYIIVMVVLYRFSTSNHNPSNSRYVGFVVVLYRFSTSNHNCPTDGLSGQGVVLYRFSTSNHNRFSSRLK